MRGYVPVALSERPPVWMVDGFASADEIAACLRVARRQRARLPTKADHSGESFELPVASAEVLGRLLRRAERLVGFRNLLGGTWRFRHYRPGEWHPPHLDAYEADGYALVLTALLTLVAPERGGETRFVEAGVEVPSRAGRLALWPSFGPDGPDRLTRHEGVRVEAGDKITLTSFFYRKGARAITGLRRSVPGVRS